MKKIFKVAIFFLAVLLPLQAEFDYSSYLKENPATISADIFYPGFFKETDAINLDNIAKEFKHRYEFFVGIANESRQKACFKTQNRINKWLSRLQQKPDQFPFKWADDRLLFQQDSPLYQMIRPRPSRVDDNCVYISYGDLQKDGRVFCRYHGPEPQSEFYQAHAHQFIETRPFITAYDVTEILIFLPFIMVIPITWLIMKKFLAV